MKIKVELNQVDATSEDVVLHITGLKGNQVDIAKTFSDLAADINDDGKISIMEAMQLLLDIEKAFNKK